MAVSGSRLPTPPGSDTGLVERVVGRVLFWGGMTSIVLLIVGLVLYASTGSYKAHAQEIEQLRHNRMERPSAVVVSLGEVVRGLTRGPIDPVLVMTLGGLILLAVPVVGVAVAVPCFVKVGDRRYAVIAAIVLGLLAVGFFMVGGVG